MGGPSTTKSKKRTARQLRLRSVAVVCSVLLVAATVVSWRSSQAPGQAQWQQGESESKVKGNKNVDKLGFLYARNGTASRAQEDGAQIAKQLDAELPILSPDNVRLAMFLTFPNSGTTYTIAMVRQYANAATIYNHFPDWRKRLFHRSMIRGPFSLDGDDPFRRLSPPHQRARYILTKTHCGASELHSTFRPSDALSTKVFEEKCRGGPLNFPSKLVRAFVHIARDPLDNIVARLNFVLFPNQVEQKAGKEKFRDWCANMDRKAFEAITKGGGTTPTAKFFSPDVEAILRRIPCAPLFVQFFTWHERAFDLADAYQKQRGAENFPVLRFHYEDFDGEAWNRTATAVLDLLGVSSATNEPAPFISGKTYHDYYTDDEKKAVGEYFRASSSERVLEFLGRYFPE